MNSTISEVILCQDIKTLPLSNEFKHMAVTNGFSNLNEILSFRLSFLLQKESFTPAVHQEFILFLHEKNLIDLLKQY